MNNAKVLESSERDSVKKAICWMPFYVTIMWETGKFSLAWSNKRIPQSKYISVACSLSFLAFSSNTLPFCPTHSCQHLISIKYFFFTRQHITICCSFSRVASIKKNKFAQLGWMHIFRNPFFLQFFFCTLNSVLFFPTISVTYAYMLLHIIAYRIAYITMQNALSKIHMHLFSDE